MLPSTSRPPALVMCVFMLAACASSNGAKKDCDPTTCPPCERPEPCPPPPKPGPTPITIAADLIPTERSRAYDLVALAADGKSALVRLEDEMAGDFFQQLDLTSGVAPKALKVWPFQGFTEPTTKKQALRALRPEAPWPPSQKSSAGLVALAADEADAVVIYLMKGERALPFARIARLKDEDGGLADVAVSKLAWDPSGTRLVVIHRQTLAAAPGFTSQWVHVLTVDPSVF